MRTRILVLSLNFLGDVSGRLNLLKGRARVAPDVPTRTGINQADANANANAGMSSQASVLTRSSKPGVELGKNTSINRVHAGDSTLWNPTLWKSSLNPKDETTKLHILARTHNSGKNRRQRQSTPERADGFFLRMDGPERSFWSEFLQPFSDSQNANPLAKESCRTRARALLADSEGEHESTAAFFANFGAPKFFSTANCSALRLKAKERVVEKLTSSLESTKVRVIAQGSNLIPVNETREHISKNDFVFSIFSFFARF